MKRLFAVALILSAAPSLAAAAEDYYGVLKPPQNGLVTGAFYSFSSPPPSLQAVPAENGHRMKLGYKYSRYFSVEGEFSDYARPADVFSNPASLTSSSFRSTGFGVDTVATLPLWNFSFYGRMGAYRGDRNGFMSSSPSLLSDNGTRGTRWRYGLGMRYDFTQSFGVRAELERHSNALGSPLAGDIDADQVTLGVSWRW
jgi:hypothetical protein